MYVVKCSIAWHDDGEIYVRSSTECRHVSNEQEGALTERLENGRLELRELLLDNARVEHEEEDGRDGWLLRENVLHCRELRNDLCRQVVGRHLGVVVWELVACL